MSTLTPSPVDRLPRPLLSRVAESAFWMARYMERAEHVARVLLVNINSLLDVGDLDAEIETAFWNGPLRIFMVDQMPEAQALLRETREVMASRISHYLTFDPTNPNSILSCITRARENARSIRENISAEMWENLNTLYWALQGEDAPGRLDESPSDLLKQVTAGSLLFQGLADQTLVHSQPWQFIQVGKLLERIDVTCRTIEVKFEILRAFEKSIETSERNMHLLSVVRSCCALEAFRRSAAEIDPDTIASFILLERHFPRAVCYSARHARDAIHKIGLEIGAGRTETVAEAILGRLEAEMMYTLPHEIAGSALAPFLAKIQTATLDAGIAVRKRYFLQ